jgi:hypothetical protein
MNLNSLTTDKRLYHLEGGPPGLLVEAFSLREELPSSTPNAVSA